MIPLMGSEKAIFKNRVTNSLHRPGMPINEVGQWESDQVGEHMESCLVVTRSMNTFG